MLVMLAIRLAIKLPQKEAGIDFIWAEYGFGTNVEKKGIKQISDLTNDPYFVDLLK